MSQDTIGYVWTGEFDLNTLRVNGEIFNSGKEKLRIQKYPDTCRRDLRRNKFYLPRGKVESSCLDEAKLGPPVDKSSERIVRICFVFTTKYRMVKSKRHEKGGVREIRQHTVSIVVLFLWDLAPITLRA